ncbi:MAG: DUF6702 family protein [Vicinamibacterales bacterium]
MASGRRTLRAWTAAVACASTIGPSAPRALDAHAFHASYTLVERNAQTSGLELTLRIFADDLETALSAASGRRVKVDETPDVDALILSYVRAAFEMRRPDGTAAALTWVGKEVRVDTVWIYVEAAGPPALEGCRVRNRVLFEQFADQVNLVQTKDGAIRHTLTFRKGDDFQTITGA